VHHVPTLGHDPENPSGAYAEQGAHRHADHLIDYEKEQRNQCDHQKHEAGGNRRLLAGRPGYPADFTSYLAHEFCRIERHADRTPQSLSKAAARRWQGWQVSNPQPPVLETGALAN
jgi:hypothetical protein